MYETAKLPEVGHKARQIGQQLSLNQQEQSQSAWDALFKGYAAASEKDQWNTLLTGYEQTKGQEVKPNTTQQEKAPEIEEKQQKKPQQGLGL